MTTIRLLDARRGLNRKCEELFKDAKIAESIYRYLCDGIEECEDVNVPERNVGKWIPVTERLPERYGRFIVTIVPEAGELWKTIELAMYSDLMGLVKTPVFWSGNVGKSDFEDVTSKVTAWMPLPEPYEGGGE